MLKSQSVTQGITCHAVTQKGRRNLWGACSCRPIQTQFFWSNILKASIMPRLCEKISFLFVKHKLNLKILLSSSLWEIKGTFLEICLNVLFIVSRAFPLIRPYSCKKKKRSVLHVQSSILVNQRITETNIVLKRVFSANPKLNNYISQWEPKKVAQRANKIFKAKTKKTV